MRSIAAAAVILLAAAGSPFPAYPQGYAPRGPAEGGASLDSRLQRLQEQIADLQGVVAAVETLAKSNAGGGSGYAAAAGGGASPEQVRQLSEQIADLTQRVERLEARLGAGGSQPAPRQEMGYGATPAPGFQDKEALPPLNAPQGLAGSYAQRPPQMAAAGQPPAGTQPRPYGTDVAAAPLPATRPAGAAQSAAISSGARALFDQGMGALNRREYSAAETYFQQYLDQYPSDPMAGTAQYWLGETAFVSGEYKSAADRFLKTFTNFPSNERAPEALLKLAISLHRLGQDTDACATFSELEKRYPQAPKTVMQRAATEKKRASCS